MIAVILLNMSEDNYHIFCVMWLKQKDLGQLIHPPAMLRPAGQRVKAGGIQAGVPQNVRQFGNILLNC